MQMLHYITAKCQMINVHLHNNSRVFMAPVLLYRAKADDYVDSIADIFNRALDPWVIAS